MTLADVSSDASDMDIDQLDFSDCRNCFILFHKFAKEVSLFDKRRCGLFSAIGM